MKKSIVAAVMTVAVCGMSYAGENLVRDGKFDSLSGWLKGWAKVQGTLELDKTEANVKSKPSALKITQTADNQYTFYRQTITVKPNTEYVFPCWMKGADIKTTRRGGALYWILQKGGKTFRNGSCQGLWTPATGTFDWKKVTLTFNTKDNTSLTLMLGLTPHATGTVWFDDVELTEKSTESAEKK